MSLVPTLLDRRTLVIGFGGVTPKQIDQAINLLSEIIDNSIDDPATDIAEFLIRLPRTSTFTPSRRSRAPAHLDSRFRRQPDLPKRPASRPSSSRTRQGAARPMAQVVSIYRYPVKGLSAQALTEAQLETGKPFPSDRIFALARPSAPIDRDNPQWAKKGLFAMLMLDEALAKVTTDLDLDDLRLTVRRKGQVAISGRLDVEKDQRALENFFWTLLPDFPAAPALVRSRGGHFMDKPDNVISMINLATVRALEELWSVPIDPLRFRANIYIDGAGPGRSSTGSAATSGLAERPSRSTARTGAAARPMSILRPANGISTSHHPFASPSAAENLGVYLVVREGGVISAGDRLALSGEGEAPAEAGAPVLTAARGRFICRGCYYIYDEAQGAPHAGAPFDALSSDWRCPDCGTDNTKGHSG